MFPNAFIIPMSREMTITQWHVPVDDTKHYWYAIFTSFGGPVNKEEMRRQRLAALRVARLHAAQEQEQRLRLRSARAGARDLYGHGRRHQRARPVGLRVDGRRSRTARASTSASPTRRSTPIAGCCARRSRPRRTATSRRWCSMRDPRRRSTGPAAVDGIGPTDDWQGYWKKTDAVKRQAASWANGR